MPEHAIDDAIAARHGRRLVLTAEDSPGDVALLREAFRHAAPQVRLESVPDGISALARLAGEGEYARAPEPDLLILDLGLPRLDGRAVLARLRTLGRRLPVIVLTGSGRRLDRADCLRLGAVHFATKPLYFGEWMRLAEFIASHLRRETNDTPTPLGTATIA